MAEQDKSSGTIPISYGDVVSINLSSDENRIIFSDGIIKTQVCLEDFSNYISKESLTFRCLFKIYPSFINTYKKEALALKANPDNLNSGNSKPVGVIEELKEKLTLEYKFNLEHYEKVQGTPIPFDQSVQFLHIASNRFLACHFKEADIERENYKLELMDTPSEATNFKISPSFKHQQESEGYIYYGDSVFIVHSNYYLNKLASLQCTYKDEGMIGGFAKDVYEFETHPHNFGDGRVVLDAHSGGSGSLNEIDIKKDKDKEINISLEKSMRWTFRHFSSNEIEEKDYLLYGNIIWLNHVEFNASMIVRKHKRDSLSLDLARVTVLDHFQQYIGNTNGMWVIEHENYLTGGLVQWGAKFRLRHFSSGRYLSLNKDTQTDNSELNLETKPNKNCLFEFVTTSSVASKQNQATNKLISKESFVRIKSPVYEEWLHVEMIGEFLKATLSSEQKDDDIFRLVKANNSEIWETNFLLSCFPVLKDYLNYLEDPNRKEINPLRKESNKYKEVQECLVQLELFCTNRLLNTSTDQKYGEINPFRQKVLREQYFLEVLRDILKNSFSALEFEKYLEPASQIEKTERTKTLLVSRFQTAVKKLFIKPKKAQQQLVVEEKTNICLSIYSLLKTICKDNAENELYAYDLLSQFPQHTKFFEEAVDCFVSIVSTNQTLLNRINENVKIAEIKREISDALEFKHLTTKVSVNVFNLKVVFDHRKNDKPDLKQHNLLQHFLTLLLKPPSLEFKRKYLSFLKCICSYNGKGVTFNQELIFQIFSKIPEFENVLMWTNLTANVLEVGTDEYTFTLHDCFKNENGNMVVGKHKNQVIYFQEQLKFYSNLLLGRNYLWKTKLEKRFPIKFVFEQISNPALSLEIRSIFCDLAFSLYIDHEPLNSMVTPNLCRIFKSNHLRNQPSLMTSAQKFKDFDQENFSKLLQSLVDIVKQQKDKISQRLQMQFAHIKEDQPPPKGDKFLDNILLANVIKLISKMVQFDLLNILNKSSYYFQLLHDLIFLVEYEKNYPEVSYTLALARDHVMQKAAPEKKQNMINMLGDLSKNIYGTVKNMAENVIGANQKKKTMNANNSADDSEDNLYLNNPIMKGLIDMNLQLDELVLDQEDYENEHESIIKEEICTMMDYMMDKRQDFLLSNILSWYDSLLYQYSFDTNYVPEGVIENEIFHVLPPVSKTGIKALDEKIWNDFKESLPENKPQFHNGQKAPKRNSKQDQDIAQIFKVYTEEQEVPDLDTHFLRGKETKSKSFNGILPSLLATFYLSNNTTLQNKLLTVIMRMFNQKQELVKNLKNLEAIFQKKDIAAYHKLEVYFTQLKLQTEASEIWLEKYVTSQGQVSGGLEEVFNLLTRIKKPFRNLSINTTKHYTARQSMIRSLAGFTPIIELIRDGMYHVKHAIANPNFPPEALQKLLETFQLAHSCLLFFCTNNEINQKILAQHLPLLLSNLDIDIGQIPLICEIIKDNKNLCETYFDTIMIPIVNIITKNGRHSSFLEPVLMLQSQRKIFSINNQTKILDYFFRVTSRNGEKEVDLLYGHIAAGEFRFKFKSESPMDQPFLYHSKILDILAINGKDTEQLLFTHTSLRRIFTIEYCLDLAVEIDTLTPLIGKMATKTPKFGVVISGENEEFSPVGKSAFGAVEDYSLIKPKIVELLTLLYLKADGEIANELAEYSLQFIQLVRREENRLQNLPSNFKPSDKFTYYLFECLIPFLNLYTVKLIMDEDDEIAEKRGLKALQSFILTFHDCFTSLAENIPYSKLKPSHELISYYCVDVSHSNNLLAEKIQQDHGLSAVRTTSARATARNNNASPATEYTRMSTDSISPLKATDRDGFELEEAVNFGKYEDSWNEFRSTFLSSAVIEQEINSEKVALSEVILKIKDVIPDDLRKRYNVEFETKGMIKKLIQFLEGGLANGAEKPTMISTLKVLTMIIETASDKTEMQDFFDKSNATNMLLSVFSDSKHGIKDDELMNEFLSFWTSLLDGGNKSVQKTIYNFCLAHQKSEVMFANFYSIIYEQISYLQLKTTMKNDAENHIKNLERSGIKSLILEKLLRLLQLFTEGHYLDLQNYLRHQTNSRNRYNMVEAVIELLRIYYSDLVQENYENILRCLDTLNEFVQGPCPENQLALIDGKFFDVVQGLLAKEVPKEKRDDKKDFQKGSKSHSYMSIGLGYGTADRLQLQNLELERWMLARLKYKILILINSLLEMRSSDVVIKRIMRSLPLEILQKNMCKVYKRYKKASKNNYSMAAFKHFENDPRDRENKLPVEHYEVILETGFLSYFLISNYLEANVQDKDLQTKIQEMQEGMETADLRFKSFLKNNMVGEFGRFWFTLFQSSLQIIKQKFSRKRPDLILADAQREEKVKEERRIKKALEYRLLMREAFDFFSKNSATIEVVRHTELEKVQFMVLPFCHEIPTEKKLEFNEKVNRQSPKTKVSDLVKYAEHVIEICKHELSLKLFFRKNKVIAVFANFVDLWKDVAFLMSVALNIFILASYSVENLAELPDYESRMHKPILFLSSSLTVETTSKIFVTLGVIMAISAVFVVMFFLIKKVPLVILEATKGEEVEEPEADIYNTTKKKNKFIKISTRILRIIFLSLKSADIVYYLAYAIFAILGSAVHPFFFAFHLTEILRRYPTLKNVIKAIVEPRRQLGLTFLFYLILTYIFSLFAFEFFADDYQGDCSSTWSCFLTTFDFTFKANGAIGGYLDGIADPIPEDADHGYKFGRFFFDFFNNIILVVIMISIVAGIIIDTFGLLREMEEEKNKDIQEKCFICGLSKEVFDRQAEIGYDFNKHIKNDHYMWNYIFFIAFLRDKDETEYTGIESYIHERLQNADYTSWFPFHKALALKNHDEDDEDKQKRVVNSFENEIDQIRKEMNGLNTMFTGLSKKLSTF